MTEIIFIVEKEIEGGFTACALSHGICTQGDDMTELKNNIKDAIRCHFDEEKDFPKVIRLHQELFKG